MSVSLYTHSTHLVINQTVDCNSNTERAAGHVINELITVEIWELYRRLVRLKKMSRHKHPPRRRARLLVLLASFWATRRPTIFIAALRTRFNDRKKRLILILFRNVRAIPGTNSHHPSFKTWGDILVSTRKYDVLYVGLGCSTFTWQELRLVFKNPWGSHLSKSSKLDATSEGPIRIDQKMAS